VTYSPCGIAVVEALATATLAVVEAVAVEADVEVVTSCGGGSCMAFSIAVKWPLMDVR
jgi:hypothetical protein